MRACVFASFYSAKENVPVMNLQVMCCRMGGESTAFFMLYFFLCSPLFNLGISQIKHDWFLTTKPVYMSWSALIHLWTKSYKDFCGSRGNWVSQMSSSLESASARADDHKSENDRMGFGTPHLCLRLAFSSRTHIRQNWNVSSWVALWVLHLWAEA